MYQIIKKGEMMKYESWNLLLKYVHDKQCLKVIKDIASF